jgi:hypothetical protein
MADELQKPRWLPYVATGDGHIHDAHPTAGGEVHQMILMELGQKKPA